MEGQGAQVRGSPPCCSAALPASCHLTQTVHVSLCVSSFQDLTSVLLGQSELNGPGPEGAVRDLTPSILQGSGSRPDRKLLDRQEVVNHGGVSELTANQM